VDFDEIGLRPAPCYQITIDCDGDTTPARMIVIGKEVKTATAKRNPADKANWRIGAQTAFDRLWQKREKQEEEKKHGGFKVGDRVVAAGYGDVLKVVSTFGDAVTLSCGGANALIEEYVVLEGYKPGRDA
jgi:hypothetical protein